MEITLLILMCALIADLVLSSTWHPGYFRFGVPLFVSRVESVDTDRVSPQWLNERYVNSTLVPLVFKSLTQCEIAFREKMWAFRLIHYTPVMHGLIQLDAPGRRVVVRGYGNWFALVLFVGLVFAGFSLNRGWTRVEFAVGVLALFGLLYGIQAVRYRRVATLIRLHCKSGAT